MKTLKTFALSALCFFSFTFSLAGQNLDLEYIFSEFRNTRISATVAIDDAIYSVGSVGSCYFPIISKSSATEDQTWYGPGGYWQFSDLALLPGATPSLLTCGFYQIADDFGSPDDSPRVLSYDLNGNLLFHTQLPRLHDAEVDPNMKLCFNGAGQIVAKSGTELYWLSTNGDLEQVKSFPDVPFVAIDSLNATTLIALGESKMYWLDNDGEKLDSLAMSSRALDLWIGDGVIYVLTEVNFLVIESPTVVQSYDVLQNTMEARGITGNENSLLFWGEDLLTVYSRIVEVERNNFTISDQTLFEQEGAKVFDLHLLADEVIVSGTAKEPENRRDFSFIKTIDLLSPPVFTGNRIAINEFRPLNKLSVTTQEVQVGADSFATIYSYKAFPLHFEFDITNEGDETIESFTFYSSLTGGVNCAEGVLYKYYDNMDLASGETKTITDSSNIVFAGSFDYEPELLVSVFAPNHRFDIDLIDNTVMVDFKVEIIAPLPLPTVALQLHPNPAQDVLFLELVKEEIIQAAAEVAIFDAQGKQVFTQGINDWRLSESKALDISQLSNGMYFLRISSEENWGIKKFVVSR